MSFCRHSIILFAAILTVGSALRAATGIVAGQDLHLSGQKLTSSVPAKGKHILVFEDGFDLSIGANKFSSDSGVVWVETQQHRWAGDVETDYQVRVYLEGGVSISRGKNAKATMLNERPIAVGESMMTGFTVTGKIFIDAAETVEADPVSNPVYRRAAGFIKPEDLTRWIKTDARVPKNVEGQNADTSAAEESEGMFSWFLPDFKENEPVKKHPVLVGSVPETNYDYPVNISGVWKEDPHIERTTMPDGTAAATIIGRFYLWKKLDNAGNIIEFQADYAVIFYGNKGDVKIGEEETGVDNLFATGNVKAIYVGGNVTMAQGQGTIRADEMFYNFEKKQALAVNSEMSRYDPKNGIPVYIRANKIAQINKGLFAAKDVTITNDEFYIPQLSANASSIIVTDYEGAERLSQQLSSRYQVEMYDVTARYGNWAFFKWPHLTSGLERPGIPLRKLSVGNDRNFGTGIESTWYMSRLLGFKERTGVKSDLLLDYYFKRGFGAGTDIEFEDDDSYGELYTYIIKDWGEDTLGRIPSRKDIEPDNDLRGRFTYRYRKYLDYGWQMTTELSYLSDRNFLESYYRDEFWTDKEQETLIHLKKSWDNQAFSILTKWRLNDFQSQTEELPTLRHNLSGQDLWGGRLTWYSETIAGRMRTRLDNSLPVKGEPFFTHGQTRQELDMPLAWGAFKVVPFVGGTYVYDDGAGYSTDINGKAVDHENNMLLGEYGLRASTMFSRTDSSIFSEIWDINGVRHTLRPHFEMTGYQASEDGLEMRDMYNVGIQQVWQTKRGGGDSPTIVDFMRFNLNATWVSDDINGAGPSRYAFAKSSASIFDRRYGVYPDIVTDCINGDYEWRISDTLAFLSDFNYGLESGQLEQLNVGVSRYVWPDLSIYVGNRYLKNVVLTNAAKEYYQKGSSSFNFAITYRINSRYVFNFAQEYNFKYGKNTSTRVALIRKYHRISYGLVFDVDASLDTSSIVFSIWPEGIRDVTIGSRRYFGLSNAAMYE